MNIVIVALGITSAMSLFAVLALLIVTRRTKRAVQSQAVHIDSLQNELNAMCSGAVGLGQHLASLEAQLKKLGKRQEQLELKEPSQTRQICPENGPGWRRPTRCYSRLRYSRG